MAGGAASFRMDHVDGKRLFFEVGQDREELAVNERRADLIRQDFGQPPSADRGVDRGFIGVAEQSWVDPDAQSAFLSEAPVQRCPRARHRDDPMAGQVTRSTRHAMVFEIVRCAADDPADGTDADRAVT